MPLPELIASSNGMKTTLELPDDLYLAAKTQAAAQKRKMKDLIAQGLKTVLASGTHSEDNFLDAQRETLTALDEILRCPVAAEGRTKELQNEVRSLRSDTISLR